MLNVFRVPLKSFFPQHWPCEKVVSKIIEAYENFIKSGAKVLEERGKYLIRGFTQEGIKIEIIITQKGVILSVYPKR